MVQTLARPKTLLSKLFKDLNARQLFYHHGNYSLAMAECIDKIKNNDFDGFTRKLYLEGKSSEILSLQIKDFEDDQKSEPKRKKHSQDFIYQDEYAENEFNQEYWSGQHYDSYNQEYPEDWVKRTHQRPRHSTFTSNY